MFSLDARGTPSSTVSGWSQSGETDHPNDVSINVTRPRLSRTETHLRVPEPWGFGSAVEKTDGPRQIISLRWPCSPWWR